MPPGTDKEPLKKLSGPAEAARNSFKANPVRNFARVNSSACPARLVTHEPVLLHTSSRSASLALPSTTATLFTALELQHSLPVHVRILLPAAAATRQAFNESSHISTLTIKAEPGTKLQEPYIKPEVTNGHTHHIKPRDQHNPQQEQHAQPEEAAPVAMVLVAELDAFLTCTQTCSSDLSVSSKRTYSLAGLPHSFSIYQGWIISTIIKVHLEQA
jgi:hypothetical protein